MELIIVILLLFLIFKDVLIKYLFDLDKEDSEEVKETREQKQYRESFNKLMQYSIDDAIKRMKEGGEDE